MKLSSLREPVFDFDVIGGGINGASVTQHEDRYWGCQLDLAFSFSRRLAPPACRSKNERRAPDFCPRVDAGARRTSEGVRRAASA